jgi:DNA-binding TFAR19-related protein (PDSD5 family)
MSDDSELRRLRLRRYVELQKKISSETKENEKESEPQLSDDDILQKVFVGRAGEVLSAAEVRYPEIVSEVKRGLAMLVKEGKVSGSISGEQLMWFFRRLGLRVTLDTHIRFSEKGDLKSLADRMKEK